MAFFDLPESQKYLEGGLHEQEDLAVYTWGEESYDGLGDALLEGGDDLNDETFGGSGPVGKDFDFESQTHQFHKPPAGPSVTDLPLEHHRTAHATNEATNEPTNISHLWENKSMFSVLPRVANASRPQEHARTGSTSSVFPTGSLSGSSTAPKPRVRTVQEIEEEMRAAARQRVHSNPQAPPPMAPEPSHHMQHIPQQQQHLTVEEVERQLAAHHISPQLAPASPHRHPQQAHHHHGSPLAMHRGHERAHSGSSLSEVQTIQLLQAQQQQQLAAQALEQAYLQQQQLIQQAKMTNVLTSASELIQAQQLYAEQQELLRQKTAAQIIEREKLDAKKRRVALKLARMAKNNDLMTQSDKDFITRIQVSQLMMSDPYEEDFYNQVFQSLQRQRAGEGQPGKGPAEGGRPGGRRRQNAMQRMEAQVERIINNVRLREKEKGMHSISHLQGALGKTSGRSYKAAPRQLLQVGSPVNSHPEHPSDAAHHFMNGGENGAAYPPPENATRKPLTTRESLILVEKVYDICMKLEHLRRDPPPAEDVEATEIWTENRSQLMEELFQTFPIRVPKDACVPHPLVSILKPAKGKRIVPRVMRQLDMSDRLDLLICIVNNFTQFDVVAESQLLDQPETHPQRRELERQTQSFLQNVYQPLVSLILELNLPPIIHMLSTLLHRGDLVRLVSSRPGIVLLTGLFAQVENIKQNIAEGAAVPAEDLAKWQWIYDEWFGVLGPHLVGLFPSTRMALNLPFGAEPFIKPSPATDAVDMPVWKFLATFSVHATLEQQQILVTVLRDKVLENLISASKGWNPEESARRVANVNQFLNALGLDSSQIAL